MKKLLFHVLFTVCATLNCAGATNELWFDVGEKLVYRLYWGVMPVGSCEMTTEWVNQDGKTRLSIKAIAKTTAVVSAIYPVNDFIETIVNPETFLPDHYLQNLSEGRHVRNDSITFNHLAGTAYWRSSKRSAANSVREIKIEADTRDVLCLAYYMRSKGLAVGQTENFGVLVDDKLYGLQVTGLNYETMNVQGLGKVKCLVVEPKAKFGGIFSRKGRVTLWFSEDARRICTKMSGKLSFANLKAVLTSVEGIGGDVRTSKEATQEEAE